jgi:transcriptional regulator with XRE-family HTH domain
MRNFGRTIYEQRRRLGLTQREIAHRIGTSTPYVGHLEGNKRHPSNKVLSRLAEVLGLDRHDLYLIANPLAERLLSPRKDPKKESAWKVFLKDLSLQRIHHITADEMNFLSKVAAIGEITSPRDLIFVLIAVRHALRH